MVIGLCDLLENEGRTAVAKPYVASPRPLAILVDEDDAGGFEIGPEPRHSIGDGLGLPAPPARSIVAVRNRSPHGVG